MRKIYLLLIIYNCLNTAFAQSHKETIIEIDTFDSKIELQELNNKIILKPILRPLIQVPGGRKPYYNYLWDFGDGHFSTLAEPTHQYSKPGEYEITLYAVNNYDDGPKPKRPKRKIKKDNTESYLAQIDPHSFENHFFSSNDIFQIFKLSDAKPGEDITLISGVNTNGKKGKIYILSNEKIAGLDGFKYMSQSKYFNEKIDTVINQDKLNSLWANVSKSTFTKTGSPDYGIKEISNFQNQSQALNYFKDLYGAYNSLTSFDVDNSEGETQFAVINLDVTENMLTDTNAIVTITGVFIADDGIANVHQVDIPVVKSHDPNKMSIKPARMNYRLQSKRKTLTYKVQFQNDGEGDAKNVRLEMSIPDEILKNSFKLKTLYPQVDSCSTPNSRGCYLYYIKNDGTLVFQFKDIALPGTGSKVLTDMDSTKGFILFDVETQKKLKNKSFNAFTNIFFDNNPPIKTNTATTRFLKTLSPIITLGANSTFGIPKTNDLYHNFKTGYQIGIGVAPTAPYKKPYWQAEVYGSYFKKESNTDLINEPGVREVNVDGQLTQREYYAYQKFQNRQYLSIQIPVQVRYNISYYLSMGAGVSLRKDFNISANSHIVYYEKNAVNNDIQQKSNTLDIDKINSDVKLNPFIDFNFGLVNIGPALGIRINYDNNQKTNAGLYGIFRF